MGCEYLPSTSFGAMTVTGNAKPSRSCYQAPIRGSGLHLKATDTIQCCPHYQIDENFRHNLPVSTVLDLSYIFTSPPYFGNKKLHGGTRITVTFLKQILTFLPISIFTSPPYLGNKKLHRNLLTRRHGFSSFSFWLPESVEDHL